MTDSVQLMRYDANKRSDVVAYLLWFFLGLFGAHRFYFNQYLSGAVLFIITLSSIVLMFLLVGYITIWVPILWWIVDFFFIARNVRKYNDVLATKLQQRSM